MEASDQPHSSDGCIPQCCCGQADCTFLDHSKKLLDSLQRDTRTAGQLGQALLIRHETYVADAEMDRRHMEDKVERLEQEKRDLEGRNAVTIEENRKLLEQLEALNTACAESELKILSMTELLRSTGQEIERLNSLAARAEGLQTQLARLEDEQMALHTMMVTTKEEQHSIVLRWQKAERTIISLQDQIEQIEQDAREERERHVEVVARIERRRVVEQQLRTSTGRPEGRAARNTLPADGNGGNVVSHFVKDILQDNANLQLGIVELKDMLDRSNEEVERLRLVMQQTDVPTSPENTSRPSLGAELGSKELHVHHHYHAPPKTVIEPGKVPRNRVSHRPKKKRPSLSIGSKNSLDTPRSSISTNRSPDRDSAASAILSQTSVTLPQPRRPTQRWSIQSNQTGITSSSSLPTSPYTDSVFDRVFSDIATDFSHPTSPESLGALSPYAMGVGHQRSDSIPRLSLDSSRVVSEGASIISQPISARGSGKGKAKRESLDAELDAWQVGHPTIPEENEDLDVKVQDRATQAGSELDLEKVTEDTPWRNVREVRRAASHESLMSISGMDIHTLQSRPSQLLASRRLFSNSPAISTSQAVLSGATAIRPSVSTATDSRSYLYGIAATQRRPMTKKSSMGNIGVKIGGWVRSPWGYSATAESTAVAQDYASIKSITTTTKSVRSASSVLSAAGTVPSPVSTSKVVMRPPGINQPGPIFGFAPERKPLTKVIATKVDEDALRESLENG